MPAISLNIFLNGVPKAAQVPDGTEPLLFVLRNQMAQVGPKFACGIAQCGACTVLVDGVITRSCVTTCDSVVNGANVSTLDGLPSNAGQPGEVLHPLQAAFIAEQAAQCAFCANGMLMGAKGWLDKRVANGNTAVPSENEIKQFLSGKSAESAFVYICRCGAHTRIVRAIQRGAAVMLAKRHSQGAAA